MNSQKWSLPFKLKFSTKIYDHRDPDDVKSIRLGQQLAFLFDSNEEKIKLLSCAEGLAKGSNQSALVCPAGCLETQHPVYGISKTDQSGTGIANQYLFAKDSSICKAAIAQGTIGNNGGVVRINKIKQSPTPIQYYQLQGMSQRL